MAAEMVLGAVTWLLDKLLGKLSEDLVAGFVASLGLNLNYETIKRELQHTQALLHEAQKREATDNPGLQGLLEDLGKKAGEADDALDELHYFIIQDKLDGTRDAAPDGVPSQVVRAVRRKVGNWLPPFSCRRSQDVVVAATDYTHKSQPHNDDKLPQFDRAAMSHKIKQLIEDIHSLCKKINNLLQIIPSNPQKVTRPITSARSRNNEFYGRDKIFEKIIGDLTGGTYRNKTLSVLPIVGPGGIGKTTLTQHLYNDGRIKKSFPVRIWICISNNTFDVLNLTQEIYSCTPETEDEDSNRANNTISNLNQLQEKIEKRLKSKRFLIVFDDMWECNNKSEWDNLLAPLENGETKGNMVLVTTRLPKIAGMVKNEEISPIQLHGLEPSEFWKFFQVCAFGELDDEQLKRDLIGIAKEISIKLKCSPLAAKTVGPLLRNNHSREHWIGILNNKEWKNLAGRGDNIMPALKISYDYLPFRLKKCFSYCALFPEDHRFHISELTRFWDAIGILDTSGQTERADVLVDGLVDNGFLIKQVDDGDQHYVLHDLLHELSQKVSSQECVNISFTGFVAEWIPPSVRHVSITVPRKCSENIEQQMNKLKTRIDIGNLRTLMIFGEYKNRYVNILKDTFNKIKDLRVLFIFMPSPESLPCNFSKLIHLRYLEIRTSSSVSLPSAISRFYHLKFFILEEPVGSRCNAPKDFNRLVNLHHIQASDEFHSCIPGVGKMECLEVLEEFRVEKESGGFELAELGKLTNLKGSLRICSLEKVETKEEGEEALLKNKSNLSELSLEFSRTGQTTGRHDAIEGLRPHPSLRGLAINGHSGTNGPSWLCRDICVTSLESLSLSGISWDVLPPFGRLPLLRSLQLSEIHGLRQFRLDCAGVSDGSFRHLEEIRFICMPDLVEWIEGDNSSHLFSKLERIVFHDCPNLTTLPLSDCNGVSTEGRDIKWFPNLREFVIEKCPKLLCGLPPMPYTSTLTNVEVYEEDDRRIYNSDSDSLSVCGYSGALALHNLGSKIERVHIEDAPQMSLTDLQKFSSLRALDVIGDMFFEEVDDSVVVPSVEKVCLKGFHPTGMLFSNVFKCLPALTEMILIDSNGELGEHVLQFPPSRLLNLIEIYTCYNLILGGEGGGAFRDLTSLQSLRIINCRKIFSQWSQLAEASQVINTLPTSIRELKLWMVGDKLSMSVLSNLTSLTRLELLSCDNLTIHGFNPLMGLSLKELEIKGCGSLAADLLAEVAKNERQLPAGSWQLETLSVDNISAVLVDPICRRLSATLRQLLFQFDKMIERFGEEQEKALQLLTALKRLRFMDCHSLQSPPTCDLPTSLEYLQFCYCTSIQCPPTCDLLVSLEHLEFYGCVSLESLPEAIHRLCSLKKLDITDCPKIQCLPKNGLPASLEYMYVSDCSDQLRFELQGLEETRPDVEIQTINS